MDKVKKDSDDGNSKALTIAESDINTGLHVLNLLDEKELAKAEVFLKKVMSSEKGGIKSVNEGFAILMRAQDLRLPFSTCCEHIHVINGKTGIDVHIIKSLLLRAGVSWECTKDYAPQYQYTDGNTIYLETQLPDYCVKCRSNKEAESITKDGIIGVYPVRWYVDLKKNLYNEFQLSDKVVIAINKVHALKLLGEKQFPVIPVPAQPIDFVTEYKLTRYRMINGKEREMVAYGRFSLSEAKQADLFTKDTYVKYARILISHRAFTLAARDIGADLLMGCMETSELKIVEGIDLSPEDYETIE